MAHHAYLITGDIGEGIASALSYGEEKLGLTPIANPDVVVFRYSHFPVEEARRIVEIASQAPLKEHRLIVIGAERLFHEAQNALLKIFEEPPIGTTLILVVPSEGQMLATMRSRLQNLPQIEKSERVLHDFVSGTQAERKKIVDKLLARSKSDKDEEKQAARAEAICIVSDLTRAAHASYVKKPTEDLQTLLFELDRFTPILHERSAPLKLIFEHLMIVLPERMV